VIIERQLPTVSKYLAIYPVILTLYTKISQIVLAGADSDTSTVIVDIIDHEVPQRIATHLEFLHTPCTTTKSYKHLMSAIPYVTQTIFFKHFLFNSKKLRL